MIALVMLACHMLGDFVLQTNWMAARKLASGWKGANVTITPEISTPLTKAERRLNAAIVRTLHVGIYTFPFALIFAISRVPHPGFLLPAIFVPHWIIDCRRWASGEGWPAKPIMVDQTLHIFCLAAVAVAFGLR